MLRALGDIAATTAEPAYRLKLYELGIRILNGCAEKLTEADVGPMCVRLAALEKLATVSVPGEVS
jgi:hypothetical protein